MLDSEPSTKTKPTIIFLDTPAQEPIPGNKWWEFPTEPDLYGFDLLQWIDGDSRAKRMSNLVTVVPVVTRQDSSLAIDPEVLRSLRIQLVSRGATDAVLSPLSSSCLDDIRVHVERVCRNRNAFSPHGRNNNNNLVGETMISTLLPDLCTSFQGIDVPLNWEETRIDAEKKALLSHAIGQFQFDAPQFEREELKVAASLIFEHAFSAPELAPWRLERGRHCCSSSVLLFCLCSVMLTSLSQDNCKPLLTLAVPRIRVMWNITTFATWSTFCNTFSTLLFA